MHIFSPAGRFTDFIYRHARFIHSFKIGFALLIATIMNWFWPLPHFLWTLVTIVIIMLSLPQVGSAMEKSLQRALGTTLGAAYGVILIACFTDYRLIMGLMILAVMLICYLASGRFSYAYLVAGFTMIIVIGDTGHDTSEAVWRTLNILLGCCIATLVSLFVLPIKAKQDWRYQLSDSLTLMTEILARQLVLDVEHSNDSREELDKINECIAAQKKLFFSLEWESLTLRRKKDQLVKLAQAQSRIVTLLALLNQTRLDSFNDGTQEGLHPVINRLAMRLVELLNMLNSYVTGQTDELILCPAVLLEDLRTLMNDHITEAGKVASDSYGYYWLIYQIAKVIENMHGHIVAIQSDC